MADYGREHVLWYMGHWLPIGATLPNYKHICLHINIYKSVPTSGPAAYAEPAAYMSDGTRGTENVQENVSAHALANKEKREKNQHHQLIRLPLRSQWKLCRSCLPWSLPDP